MWIRLGKAWPPNWQNERFANGRLTAMRCVTPSGAYLESLRDTIPQDNKPMGILAQGEDVQTMALLFVQPAK